jgi:uncharacterized protein with LGFP repeats
VQYHDGQSTVVVEGETCSKWQRLGAGRGILGVPVTPSSGSYGTMRQHFQNGSIFATAAGVFEVHGAIAQLYSAHGYDRSCLGLPISDEESYGAGRRSRFEHGEVLFLDGVATEHCN